MPVSDWYEPAEQIEHNDWPVSAAYVPEAQVAHLVLNCELNWPAVHGVHDVGHVTELMSAGVATGLAGEEPSVPDEHPFWTIAEAVQERVPIEVNVLSGQARSSLAAPSR